VYDVVALESGPLFTAKNERCALRNFQQMMDKVHNVDDYLLYEVGLYDEQAVSLVGHDKMLISGKEDVDG
jgi:hypothetical protein